MHIAVLAVQGAFIEHRKKLERLGVSSIELRNIKDLSKEYQGIILPGGESTTMCKLLNDLNMIDTLREQIRAGMPVFGTCAGMILLAKNLSNDTQKNIGTMNIKVRRNAYGRQLGSFQTIGDFAGKSIEMTFIRAPSIENVGESLEILSTVNNHIVAARQENQLITAFHPELAEDSTVHEYFISIVNNSNK